VGLLRAYDEIHPSFLTNCPEHLVVFLGQLFGVVVSNFNAIP